MPFTPPRSIRPIAICVIRRSDSILVFEGYDSVDKETFYRPLGGSIEFGELGAETVVRELQEEIDAELVDLRFLGVLENIFVYEGHPGHEIVMVYEAQLASRDLYETPVTTGREDGGAHFKVMWKSISDFGSDGAPLYPDGLAELLAKA